jgi:transposase
MLWGMHVKVNRVRRGNRTYRYLSIVESVRRDGKATHRELLRLGEASTLAASGQLDRLIAGLQRFCDEAWIRASEIEAAEDAPSVGTVAAAWAYWCRLGLDGWFERVGVEAGLSWSLADAVFAMVANRIAGPCSKRRLHLEWLREEVVMPAGFSDPELHQYYRALDHVAATKAETETYLYGELCDLANLDLTFVCYDLTSTYFEAGPGPSVRFPSRAFGYSRDHRSDRPQIVIGLLMTADGVPVAHHVFAGNTADVSTLTDVLDDLKGRFGVKRICLVADRGLVSAANIEHVVAADCDYIVATRLHQSPECHAALEASTQPSAHWQAVPEANTAVCDVTIDTPDVAGRYVVCLSQARHDRDSRRRAELIARTEEELLALENRVRYGRLKDARTIAARAARILADSPLARVFDIEVDHGHFLYHFNEAAYAYEELLAGRYVLATSLDPQRLPAPRVLTAYRGLQEIERRFRILKDFLALRPVYHWTEARVRGHVAVCVYAALIEALLGKDLHTAGISDPHLPGQTLTTQGALRELARIRQVTLDIPGTDEHLTLLTRRTQLQTRILNASHTDLTPWTPHP